MGTGDAQTGGPEGFESSRRVGGPEVKAHE
jgi:hypothetical protein